MVLAFAAFLRVYLDTDRDGALPALRTAVRRAPSSVLILNAAGWSESYVLNFDVAIACLRRAVRLDPMGHVGAYSRLGWGICESLVGRFGAAAAMLEQALADDGPTGGLLQALLVTYWHQGRKAEARGLVP